MTSFEATHIDHANPSHKMGLKYTPETSSLHGLHT